MVLSWGSKALLVTSGGLCGVVLEQRHCWGLCGVVLGQQGITGD